MLHAKPCTGCDESTSFTCDVCGREFAACMGAADDKPNTCDDCYWKHQYKKHKFDIECSNADVAKLAATIAIVVSK